MSKQKNTTQGYLHTMRKEKILQHGIYALLTMCITIISFSCDKDERIEQEIKSVMKKIEKLNTEKANVIEDSLYNNNEFLELTQQHNDLTIINETKKEENQNLQEIANKTTAKKFPLNTFLTANEIYITNLRIHCENLHRRNARRQGKATIEKLPNLDTLTHNSNIADFIGVIYELDNNIYEHETHKPYIQYRLQDSVNLTSGKENISFNNKQKNKMFQKWKDISNLENNNVAPSVKKIQRMYQENKNTISENKKLISRREQIISNINDYFDEKFNLKRDSLNKVLEKLKEKQK